MPYAKSAFFEYFIWQILKILMDHSMPICQFKGLFWYITRPRMLLSLSEFEEPVSTNARKDDNPGVYIGKQYCPRSRKGWTIFEVLEQMLETKKFYSGYKWLEGRHKLEEKQVESLRKVMVKSRSKKAEQEWTYATFYKDVRLRDAR